MVFQEGKVKTRATAFIERDVVFNLAVLDGGAVLES